MVRSPGEVRKPVRWLRADRAQRLRLPGESRGEDRPHRPDAALWPGRCLQQPRALPQTAPQIDALQLAQGKFPVSQIPVAQPRLRKVPLLSLAGISRQSSDPERECVQLTTDASKKLNCPNRLRKTGDSLPRHEAIRSGNRNGVRQFSLARPPIQLDCV